MEDVSRVSAVVPCLPLCTDYPCSGMLGMVSGQISDAQISASSYADRGWVAENARLLTGRTGWTGQQVKQPFRNEWLQVGFILKFGFCIKSDYITWLRSYRGKLVATMSP